MSVPLVILMEFMDLLTSKPHEEVPLSELMKADLGSVEDFMGSLEKRKVLIAFGEFIFPPPTSSCIKGGFKWVTSFLRYIPKVPQDWTVCQLPWLRWRFCSSGGLFSVPPDEIIRYRRYNTFEAMHYCSMDADYSLATFFWSSIPFIQCCRYSGQNSVLGAEGIIH